MLYHAQPKTFPPPPIKNRKSSFLQPRSVLVRNEPLWRDAGRAHPPSSIRSWLEEPASLTARLRRTAGLGFGVKLMRQNLATPFAGEALLLEQAYSRLALVREVLLYAEQGPLVLARTVMPEHSLRGRHCGLARLGNRPLGEVLFAQRGLRRTVLQLACLRPQDWQRTIQTTHQIEQPIWGRRSLYEIDRVSLIVCEFFLPIVQHLSSSNPSPEGKR